MSSVSHFAGDRLRTHVAVHPAGDDRTEQSGAAAGVREQETVGPELGQVGPGRSDVQRYRYATGELPDDWINSVVVGADGKIRYKHIGPVTHESLEQEIMPVLKELLG